MNRVFHRGTIRFVLFLAILLAAPGCRGRATVEETVQREIEAITAMKQLSLVEYRASVPLLPGGLAHPNPAGVRSGQPDYRPSPAVESG